MAFSAPIRARIVGPVLAMGLLLAVPSAYAGSVTLAEGVSPTKVVIELDDATVDEALAKLSERFGFKIERMVSGGAALRLSGRFSGTLDVVLTRLLRHQGHMIVRGGEGSSGISRIMLLDGGLPGTAVASAAPATRAPSAGGKAPFGGRAAPEERSAAAAPAPAPAPSGEKEKETTTAAANPAPTESPAAPAATDAPQAEPDKPKENVEVASAPVPFNPSDPVVAANPILQQLQILGAQSLGDQMASLPSAPTFSLGHNAAPQPVSPADPSAEMQRLAQQAAASVQQLAASLQAICLGGSCPQRR